MIWDYIIVGAGIAGLYYSYLLKKEGCNNFLLLESSHIIGGRVGIYDFHGKPVVTGAGIGRYDKDKSLLKLLDDLEIKYTTYTTKINYLLPFKELDILKILQTLKKDIQPSDLKLTFKDFLLKKLGKIKAYQFITSSGYTDYLSADVEDTLLDYGFEDNVSGYKAVRVPWKELLDNLEKYIGNKHICLQTQLKQISHKNDLFNLECDKEGKQIGFLTKKLILAIPPKCVYKILKNKIYKTIENNNFMRLYVKLDPFLSKEFMDNITTFTFLEPPIQKIIPIDNKEGIYMLSYSDNKSAVWVSNASIKRIEQTVKQYTGYDIKITDHKKFFWKNGTHYYTALNRRIWEDRDHYLSYIQNPEKNLYVIGEAYSKNQGWVQGALESVDKIVYK